MRDAGYPVRSHVMEHPDYPELLHVGCVCAEHMEEDYVRPKEREKRLKRVARRRPAWARREWQMSRQGNPYINTGRVQTTPDGVPRKAASGWRSPTARRRVAHRTKDLFGRSGGKGRGVECACMG